MTKIAASLVILTKAIPRLVGFVPTLAGAMG
jgi:hypothetical protein